MAVQVEGQFLEMEVMDEGDVCPSVSVHLWSHHAAVAGERSQHVAMTRVNSQPEIHKVS